jgi:hypothetical protein
MLLSCVAHFAWWLEAGNPEAARQLASIGMIATPMFLLISGAMIGLVFTRQQSNAVAVRNTFFNRGLFVLIVGHVGIALAEAHRGGGLLHTLPVTFATDAIGLASMLAAMTMGPELLRTRTVWLAAAAFMLAWVFVLYWHPAASPLVLTKQLFFGREPTDRAVMGYTSPFVQYIAIVAAGIPLGRMLAQRCISVTETRGAGWTLFKVGAAMIGTSVLCYAVKFLAFGHGTETHWPALYATLSIFKIPPSPVYVLFYAGLGLSITGTLLWCAGRKFALPYIQWAAVIGRASLFIFVFQYFSLWTLPDLLGIKPGAYASLVFVGNIALIWCVARFWTAFDGNRLMTFGIRLVHAH